MNAVFAFVTSACLLTLGGCAMGWTRPNTTEAQASQDRLQCEQQAASMYPVVMAPNGAANDQLAALDCATSGIPIDCGRTADVAPPPQTDANAPNRSAALSSCLESKGYVFKVGN